MNHRGNSIIEVMVVIIILTSGIVGSYGILNSWQRLAQTSENRIKAINIAREWIEAVENIRDTNWIKFSSDYTNCWRVKDYNASCIGNSSASTLSGSNVLIQTWSLWYLSGVSNPSTTYTGQLAQFPVYLDSDWLFTSSWNVLQCNRIKSIDCKSIFTRQITINYPSTDHMTIHSVVTWVDNSKSTPFIIDLETTLTNWKKNF